MELICTKCNEKSDISDCATCGSWTCPKCGNVNVITPTDAGIDWNSCVEFDGPESALPTGMAHLPKGISVLDMLADVKKTKSGGILSVTIDEEVYKELVATYGEGQILIANANGKAMTRTQWYNQMGQSDGLKLAIIRELNKGEGARKPFKIGG